MFYYRIFIVLSLITIGSSVPARRSLLNEPQRCCGVKEFNSKIIVSTGMALPSGQSYASYGHYNLSYDGNRGLIGLKGISINLDNEKQTSLWIIKNMHDGQTYVIDLDTNQCSKTFNPIKPFNCIPETATYIDSSMYRYQDKQIIGDTWIIKINGTTSYSTVSRSDCVPLTEHHFFNEPRTVTSMTTTDYVEHIDDLSVFDIPTECLTLA